jgi:biotin carboxyl carrier protein
MAKVTIAGRSYEVEVKGEKVIVDGHEYAIAVREESAYATVNAGGVSYRVQLPPPGARETGMEVQVDHRPFTVEWEGKLGSGGAAPREARHAASGAAPAQRTAVKGGVSAQIAGKVLSIKVKVGDTVARGDVLLTLEAMKMENEIKSPADGVVKELPVAEGARVAEGETLAVIE